MKNAAILRNCIVGGNSAVGDAGGVCLWGSGRMENCTVVGNTSSNWPGGGVIMTHANMGTAVNSIIYNNTANDNGGDNYHTYREGAPFSYCCSVPAPTGGLGNVVGPPLFVVAEGNYQLQASSPCVDSGTNLTSLEYYVSGVYRPLDGNNDGVATWDIGAHEYVHLLADTDKDGFKDSDEIAAGTSPINSESLLRCDASSVLSSDGVLVRWHGESNRLYSVERSTNLIVGFNHVVQSNIPTVFPQNVVTDRTAVVTSPCFYRIRVE